MNYNHITITGVSVLLTISAIIILALFPDIGLAGTGGTEFKAAESRVSEIIGGTGGKLVAALSLGFAMLGSILKFNPYAVASAIGVGMMSSMGVAVVQTGITAVI